LQELQQVLASPHFCNSKRYPALLQYIVEKSLAGESDSLKERTLGVEVFDRPATYDTNADTIVRYTAGEVRKRLSLYYHELGHKTTIQLSLPAGSYVPEFIHTPDPLDDPLAAQGSALDAIHAGNGQAQHSQSVAPGILPDSALQGALPEERLDSSHKLPHALRLACWVIAVILVLLAVGGFKYRAAHAKTPLDSFWAPVLHDQPAAMLCIGGSVFKQNNFSGVETAGKDVDYPFVSMQSASAVAQLSSLIERSGGATPQLQASATTSLTELREHPVILLGAYNNQWSLRLLQPLRFHLSPYPPESIVDQAQPQIHWQRDLSQPYSSTDDYAIVARFHDATTDSWVVVLAGVGRNGTEAAAQFATSPHYMQMLRDRAGDFSNRNVETVLRLSVIDGKTGAPSIEAVHVW